MILEWFLHIERRQSPHGVEMTVDNLDDVAAIFDMTRCKRHASRPLGKQRSGAGRPMALGCDRAKHKMPIVSCAHSCH